MHFALRKWLVKRRYLTEQNGNNSNLTGYELLVMLKCILQLSNEKGCVYIQGMVDLGIGQGRIVCRFYDKELALW